MMYLIYLATLLTVTSALININLGGGSGNEDTLLTVGSIVSLSLGSCHQNILGALPKLQDLRITCINEALDAAGLRDFIENNIKLPAGSDALVKYLRAFEGCKLRVSGALKNDIVDFDAYFNFLDLPDLLGLDEDLNLELDLPLGIGVEAALGLGSLLNPILGLNLPPLIDTEVGADVGVDLNLRLVLSVMHTCRELSGGLSPVDTLINFDRCIEIKLLESCDLMDKQIGLENLLRIVFLSANTPSKCPAVKMPEADLNEWLACAKKATDSIDITGLLGTVGTPDLGQLILNLNLTLGLPLDLGAELGAELGADLGADLGDTLGMLLGSLSPVYQCFVKSKGFNNIIQYILSLGGWEKHLQQRTDIFNAYTACAKYIPTPAEILKSQNSYDLLTQTVTKISKFIDCIAPEISRICGLNSVVAELLIPLLNPLFRESLTGEIPNLLTGVLKAAVLG